MKKKLLSLALVLVMALTLLPTAAFAEGGADLQDPPVDNASTGTPAPAATTCSGCGNARTHHDASPATCQAAGTIEYWECNCGNFSTETGSDKLVSIVDPQKDHTPAAWVQTAENHSRTCSVCNTVIDAEAAHTFNSTTGKCTVCQYECTHNGTTTGTCSICQKVLSTSSDPNPTLEHVDEKPATCTATGLRAHYVDKTNNKYYYDADGKQPVSLNELTISALGHVKPSSSAGYERTSDTQHSYTCTRCNQKIAES